MPITVFIHLLLGFFTAAQPVRVVTYEVRVRGEVEADIGVFRNHVRTTLRNPAGWSMSGDILFLPVSEGSDFVLWLADAETLPEFSPGCSALWSCRAGRDVVINEDRWDGGAPGWAGDLDSYRHYVVNHEVGHWLGLGHRGCDTPGEPAPVMMQQSKSPAPCKNRVWPEAKELVDALAAFEAKGTAR